MTRQIKILIAGLGVFALCSSGYAENDGRCPSNDKRLPERSVTCKGGAVWVCEAGEWRRQDGSRCG
jgi:hypothetical protein